MGQRVTGKMKKCFELNENTTYTNFWDATKVLREVYSINAHIRKRKNI